MLAIGIVTDPELFVWSQTMGMPIWTEKIIERLTACGPAKPERVLCIKGEGVLTDFNVDPVDQT